MTEYDANVAAILDRLVPPLSAEPNGWQALLHDAGASPPRLRWAPVVAVGKRKDRALVLAAAIVVAVMVAIPALAVSKGWWFLGSGAPRPQTNVALVTSGRSAGIDWTLTAYVSGDKGVCVALTPDVGPGDTGSMDCGTELRGEPIPSLGQARAHHWIGYSYFSLGHYDFPDFVFGAVAVGVDRVDVVLSDGQIIGTETLEGPDTLAVPLDFYAVSLPGDISVKSLIARDRSGNVLERRACAYCAPHGLLSSGQSGPKVQR